METYLDGVTGWGHVKLRWLNMKKYGQVTWTKGTHGERSKIQSSEAANQGDRSGEETKRDIHRTLRGHVASKLGSHFSLKGGPKAFAATDPGCSGQSQQSQGLTYHCPVNSCQHRQGYDQGMPEPQHREHSPPCRR